MIVKKKRSELQSMVLEELRKVPHCEGATSVTVVGLNDARVAETWTVSNFNAGQADQGSCEEALWRIVPRLQQKFDIADSKIAPGAAGCHRGRRPRGGKYRLHATGVTASGVPLLELTQPAAVSLHAFTRTYGLPRPSVTCRVMTSSGGALSSDFQL
jgi:hypothetical protein